MADPPRGGGTAADPAEQVLDLDLPAVRALLAERYGLPVGALTRVDGELSTVCRAEGPDGRLAVKVTRDVPGRRAALDWQAAVARSAAAHGVPVPRPLPDRDGAVVSAADAGGVPVLVCVEQWLDGTPLRDVAADEPTLREVGRTAARLSRALRTAPAPPAGLTHAWEASRGRSTILAALPGVPNAETAALTSRAAEAFGTDVEPLLPALPRAVVHQDLHEDNLLVGRVDGRPRVVGVLDFGDAVHGLRVAELAVAAGYAARLTTDPLDGLLAVVAGWGEEAGGDEKAGGDAAAGLDDAEVAALLPLARTRLAVNAAVWGSRSAGPRAAYAAARSAGSLPALRALLAADRDEVAAALRRLVPRGPCRRRHPEVASPG